MNSVHLQRKLVQHLQQVGLELSKPQLTNLALCCQGLAMSHDCHLTNVALGLPTAGQRINLVQRLRRFLDHDSLSWTGGNAFTIMPDGTSQRDTGTHDGMIAGGNGEGIGISIVLEGPAEVQRVGWESVVIQTETRTTVYEIDPLTGNRTSQVSQTFDTENRTENTLNTDNRESIEDQINSGQGTMGLLMHDAELYNNLTQSAADLSSLLEDLETNPHRYLHIAAFDFHRERPADKQARKAQRQAERDARRNRNSGQNSTPEPPNNEPDSIP